MLGHEYGWTPDYVLDHLNRAQIEALIAAIGRRYAAQAKATGGEDAMAISDDMSPAALAAFGVEVR